MRFYCIDPKSKNIIFHYIDAGEEKICTNCTELSNIKITNKKCLKNRYFSSSFSHDKKYLFCFCLKNIKTKNKAKFIVKQTINAFLNSQEIASNISALRLSANDLALHNTKNLHAEINNKLLSLFNEEELSRHTDKISFIEKEICVNPKKFAREILSILKSTSQIMHEYNIIDFVDPSTRLQRADFGYHKVHTLCVMCFYLYELEFKEKKIQVKINQSFDNVYVNWGTAKTAISQIFDNALKYCKEETELIVDFVKHDLQNLDITFEMTSLYFSKEESKRLTQPKYRGELAEQYEGKGAGMAIVQRMMELNEGLILCESFANTKFISGKCVYSTNKFTLRFRSAAY